MVVWHDLVDWKPLGKRSLSQLRPKVFARREEDEGRVPRNEPSGCTSDGESDPKNVARGLKLRLGELPCTPGCHANVKSQEQREEDNVGSMIEEEGLPVGPSMRCYLCVGVTSLAHHYSVCWTGQRIEEDLMMTNESICFSLFCDGLFPSDAFFLTPSNSTDGRTDTLLVTASLLSKPNYT